MHCSSKIPEERLYKILTSWNKIRTRFLTWNCYKIPSRISFKIHAWVTKNLGKIPKTISIQFFFMFLPRISPRSPPGFSSKFLLGFPPRFSTRSLPGFLTKGCCKILSDSWQRFFQDLVLDSVKTWIALNWTKNIYITLDWFDRY